MPRNVLYERVSANLNRFSRQTRPAVWRHSKKPGDQPRAIRLMLSPGEVLIDQN